MVVGGGRHSLISPEILINIQNLNHVRIIYPRKLIINRRPRRRRRCHPLRIRPRFWTTPITTYPRARRAFERAVSSTNGRTAGASVFRRVPRGSVRTVRLLNAIVVTCVGTRFRKKLNDCSVGGGGGVRVTVEGRREGVKTLTGLRTAANVYDGLSPS